MGSTEQWVVIKSDGFYLHIENDCPRVLRKGLEAVETKISLHELVRYYTKAQFDKLEQQILEEIRGAKCPTSTAQSKS
jgi:hypothetical protein